MRRFIRIWVVMFTVVGLVGCAAPSAQAPPRPTAAPTSMEARRPGARATTPAPTVTATVGIAPSLPVVYFIDAFG